MSDKETSDLDEKINMAAETLASSMIAAQRIAPGTLTTSASSPSP